MQTGRLVVGISGASGAIYAQRLLLALSAQVKEIYLVLSEQAVQVINTELGVALDRENFTTSSWLGRDIPNIQLLDHRDFYTPPASGSFRHDGMVICPCSMGTLGRIANGISNDLMTRAADVCLKEQRPLVLVPREMPWNLIMLRNAATVVEAGGTILPACPAWYQKPTTLEDLADTVVARIVQTLGYSHTLAEWMKP